VDVVHLERSGRLDGGKGVARIHWAYKRVAVNDGHHVRDWRDVHERPHAWQIVLPEVGRRHHDVSEI